VDELAREKAEVERLRALLVTRDGELGAARGQLKHLEARSRYLMGAIRRLRELPANARRLLGGLRGPRG
jgi:hypothetical protein